MAGKQLMFEDEGRRKILRGVEQLAHAVKVTQNIPVDKVGVAHIGTKDSGMARAVKSVRNIFSRNNP